MAERIGAFFDVDGTLLRGNIVRYYAFLRRREMGAIRRQLWSAGLLARVPCYLILDRISRELLTTWFYKNYRKFTPLRLHDGANALFHEELKPNLYPRALKCIETHRAAGHVVVLVSGSIQQIVSPVAEHVGADGILCTELVEEQGAFTGALKAGSLTGARKAKVLKDFARRHQISLPVSHAYADSLDDVPMLDCVGHPVVINPERRLRKLASDRGWIVKYWRPDGGNA
jgi:HAD superfamily hydrolase (TIGR01490 family)